MSNKVQIYLLTILLFFTAFLTTHYFELGMMGLTTFVLAYISKGMRNFGTRRKKSDVKIH